MSGCPYIAGPACWDCDGSCWEAGEPGPAQPDPCEVCSRIANALTDCLGYCAGIYNQDDLDAQIAAYRNDQPPARAATATPTQPATDEETLP